MFFAYFYIKFNVLHINLHTIERDVKHLDEVYNLGLEVAKESMPALKAYLNK